MAGKPGQISSLPATLPAGYQRGYSRQMDKRSRIYRSVAAASAALSEHLGGEQEISVTQLWLIERAAYLEHRLRAHESSVLIGRQSPMSEGEYANLLGQFTGLCKTLGLHRKAKRVPTLAERLGGELP